MRLPTQLNSRSAAYDSKPFLWLQLILIIIRKYKQVVTSQMDTSAFSDLVSAVCSTGLLMLS